MEIEELLAKFETGDVPTGKDFADLIRLCYNSNYKLTEMDIAYTLPANTTSVDIPLDVDYNNITIDLYINSSLINKTQHTQSYNNKTLTIITAAAQVARSGFIRIKKIEEVAI